MEPLCPRCGEPSDSADEPCGDCVADMGERQEESANEDYYGGDAPGFYGPDDPGPGGR